jgi:L-ascorbate 6-phosphate lactonase
VLEANGERLLVTGDTSLTDDLLDELRDLAPFKAAFLPVNERNYMREKAGIIGNMTLREAFWLASELNVATLVPQHWDMFAANAVHREEIELLYKLEAPPFALLFPEGEVQL